jgi:hypothetical protein
MSAGRSWATNKAEFIRDAGGLRKRYFRVGDAARDCALLDRIAADFPSVLLDGWSYRPLRVLDVDPGRNEMLMEYVVGEDLGTLFDRTGDPALFAHAGRWLGAFHRATGAEDGSVLVFNDFNRTNIIVDIAGKVVVAVDPGGYAELRVHPSQSLVMGAFSISRVALRRLTIPLNALRHFVTGYRDGAGRPDLPPIAPGIRYLLGRFRTGRSHAPIRRPDVLRTPAGALECAFLAAAIRWVAARR